MIQYRKIGTRAFFKIHDEIVTRIIIKEKQYEILVGENWLLKEQATDPSNSKECSEEEFNEAKKSVMQCI